MGNGLSQLTEDQVKQLKETTPFEEADMVRLLKRYSQYDETDKGTDGIPYNTMLAFPELQAKPIVQRVLDLYVNKGNKTLYAEKFLYFFAVLNKNTSVPEKREVAFRCFDTAGRGVLGPRELYQVLSLLYGSALSGDHLLRLVDHALSQPHLATPGQLSQDEFNEMISDWEILNLFTLDLQKG